MTEAAPPISSLPPDFADASSNSPRWPLVARFGFWFAFFFLLLSLITVYGIVSLVPLVGQYLQSWIDTPWQTVVAWLGTHLFHLTGVAAHPHGTDSRDEALDWISAALSIVVSLLAAAGWTLFGRRSEYRTVGLWLRLVLRLSLVFLMFRYGLMKLFPQQMPPPALAVLNEPVGNTSQLSLLWTLLGLHPGYEMLCGAIETAAAVLLIFRRTALMGAVLAIITMTNVLLYNMFFDVPVKLGAAIILLVAIAVAAPDLGALYTLLWRHRPAALTSQWVPPGSSPVFRRSILAIEVIVIAMALYRFTPGMWRMAQVQQAHLRNPSPLTGEWRVESAVRTVHGHAEPAPVLLGNGQPMSALFLEPNGDAKAQAADGRLWRVALASESMAAHQLSIEDGYFDGVRFSGTYGVAQPDSMHLVLTPVGHAAQSNSVLTMARVPLPGSYPLLDQKFHWINEWGMWR